VALSQFVRDLESRANRDHESRQKTKRPWEPRKLLFKAQLEVFDDRTSPRIVVDCSRRSGKSFLAAVLLTDLSLGKPKHNSLYLTQSSEDTREILWKLIKDLNEEYSLGGETNETRLEIVYPNGSFIRLAGCKDHNEAKRRIKGRRWHFVIVDEGQAFPAYIEEMVEAGLIPTLMGKGGLGRIMMAGTPADCPGIGYYEQAVLGGQWGTYHWTIRENESLDQAEVEAYLADRAEKLGPRSAIHLREDLGERPPPDASSGLVYIYDREKNSFKHLPEGGIWHVVLSVDLGHRRDTCATTVLGVNNLISNKAWLLDEWKAPRRLPLPDLAKELLLRQAGRRHDGSPFVPCARPNAPERILGGQGLPAFVLVDTLIDEGGLGSAIADELRRPVREGEDARPGIVCTAAEKANQNALVSTDTLNSALITGRLMIHESTQTAKDLAILRWDPNELAKGRRKMAKTPHSDLEPTLRYAWPTVVSLFATVKAPVRMLSDDERDIAEAIRLRKIKPKQLRHWRTW
jgi:hypothetical protein